MSLTNYIVYMHKLLYDGRRYIGITQLPVKRRWANGYGYIQNAYFWRTIKKYGWDSFEHIVLFENLSKEQACAKEKALIKLFNTTDSKYGFNLTSGGEHYEFTNKQRQYLSQVHTVFDISASELNYFYNILNWPQSKLADHYGCSKGVISKNLKKFGIKKAIKRQCILVDPLELTTLYVEADWTIAQCATHFKCSSQIISNTLKYYHIEKATKCKPSYDLLYKLYIINNWSRSQCARYLNLSQGMTKYYLKLYNIKKEPDKIAIIKTASGKKNLKNIPAKELYDLLCKGYSRKDCANYFHCCTDTIATHIKLNNFEVYEVK